MNGLSKTKHAFYERMLRIADEIGAGSNDHRYKFGSLLVYNKTIISSGHNYRKTHPVVQKYGYKREVGKQERTFVHSEVSCTSKMRVVPKGAILFVSRRDRNGARQLARPCPVCMTEIRNKKIGEIVYTTPDGFAVEYINYD